VPLERTLDAEVRRALAILPGVSVMPNEAGVFRTLDGTRTVRAGLGVGSSDLVGIIAPHGRWFCIELKTKRGRVRKEQALWLAHMERMGAAVGVARTVGEAVAIVESGRAGQ